MPIRLLISDLDGTLLGPEGRITPPTAEALQRARRAGISLLVATGRSWKTASPLLAKAGVAADFVLLNGAEARTAQGELLRAVSLPPAAARQTVAVLGRYGLGFEVNTDGGDFTTDTDLCPTAQPFPSLVDFWARQPQVRKIFAFSHHPDALARARQMLQTRPDVTVTTSASWNLEVTARDAQKGPMARWMAARYGIPPEEVLVFGDGCNDRSLFGAFPHTRAMGNGDPALQALAERVIASNARDGVAREIDGLLSARQAGALNPA